MTISRSLSSRVQAIGLTRWSYPAAGTGFRKNGNDVGDLRARLYAPHRLDHRLFLLENVLLPGLKRQSDPDFTHLFLMGDQLPDPWRSRVLDLLAKVPQITPFFAPEGRRLNDVCREAIHDHTAADCEVTAQYRLDDDDGLAASFIGESRRLFDTFEPLYETQGRFGLDFNRGFILQTTAQDLTMRPVSMRFWAPGMVVFQRRGAKRTALDYNHLKLWHYMPTMTWQEEPMFIRGAHHDNDSHLSSFGRRARGFVFDPPNPRRYFKKTFGVNLNRMQRVWDAQKAYFLQDAPPEVRQLKAG